MLKNGEKINMFVPSFERDLYTFLLISVGEREDNTITEPIKLFMKLSNKNLSIIKSCDSIVPSKERCLSGYIWLPLSTFKVT